VESWLGHDAGRTRGRNEVWGMDMSRGTLLATLAVVASLFGAAPAVAGQIVYTHGHDLWVMNDNGTGQRALVTQAQAGGPIGFAPSGANPGSDLGVGVQPGGNGVAFDAEVNGTDGQCATNCPGLYSLLGGKLLRLSGPPSGCGNGITLCGSEDTDPAVSSTGRVVYYSLFASSTPDCGIDYCGYDGGSTEEYNSRALDGSDSPALWPLPSVPGGNDTPGADPGFDGALAADPADPTKIAYSGNPIQGLDFVNNHACGPTGDSNCYPLDVETSSGAVNQIGIDDSFYESLAFSQDGTRIADVETGDNKGIWVYSSTQSYGSPGAPNPAAQFTWALEDPDNVAGAGQFDRVINGLAFVGNNEIVFSADNNLWSIPASCWATPSPTAPKCGTFPSGATQLTHDGDSTNPNAEPAWTSSTTPITAFGGGGNNGGGNNGGGGGDQISKVGLGSSSVASGKPVTLSVTLKSGATIKVKILRFVPASGHGRHRHKAHYAPLGSASPSGHAGLNLLKLTKIGGHKLKPGKYELLISAGGRTYTLKFKIRA
jgi:hypothetical protein